ncbi:hypothetical protein P308_13180 [Pseudomonas piscis]|nr:hypothetical protein P308_13180 [Pseudomonas piscis]
MGQITRVGLNNTADALATPAEPSTTFDRDDNSVTWLWLWLLILIHPPL